jgi:hypothetical protein
MQKDKPSITSWSTTNGSSVTQIGAQVRVKCVVAGRMKPYSFGGWGGTKGGALWSISVAQPWLTMLDKGLLACVWPDSPGGSTSPSEKIVEIDILPDPERLRRLDLSAIEG